jgi:hypothetical protein
MPENHVAATKIFGISDNSIRIRRTAPTKQAKSGKLSSTFAPVRHAAVISLPPRPVFMT